MYYEVMYQSVETGSLTNEIFNLKERPTKQSLQVMLDESQKNTTGIARKIVDFKVINSKDEDVLKFITRDSPDMFGWWIDWKKQREKMDRRTGGDAY